MSTTNTTISHNGQRINSPNPSNNNMTIQDQQQPVYQHKHRNNFHSSDRAMDKDGPNQEEKMDFGPLGVINQYIAHQNIKTNTFENARNSIDQKISMASRNGKLKITKSPAPPQNDMTLLPTINKTPQVTSGKNTLINQSASYNSNS